jgi:hypothetical protein
MRLRKIPHVVTHDSSTTNRKFPTVKVEAGFDFPGCQGPERQSGSGMLSKLNSMFRRALGNRCECDVAQAQRDKAGDYVIPAEVLRLTIERYMRNMPPAQRDEGSAKA